MSEQEAQIVTPFARWISSARWIALKRRLPVLIGAIAVVLACIVIKNIGGRPEADAQPAGAPKQSPKSAARPVSAPQADPQIVAVVNGEEIQRQELGRECMSVYGKEVLESLVNKQLIMRHCQQHQVIVSSKDVNDEIDRMARKFGITTDEYLKMLKQERGIKHEQYAGDIVWPMLALRRLAKEKIVPTKAEVDQAFQSQYGEAVKARLIVLDNAQLAGKVHAQAVANPVDFGALAKKYSKDPSASMNGLVQPIRRFMGHIEIEKAAFALHDGDVSPIVAVAFQAGAKDAAPTQYVILKCEGRMEPMAVNRALVEERLKESIVERKLRTAAAEIFEELQRQTKILNVYNNPELRQQMPGVVAMLNEQKITVLELSNECVKRHGVEVLEGTISRRLLEQALRRENLTVAQEDMDAEVGRAALAMGQHTEDGQPNVKAWLKIVTEQQNLPLDVYLRDSVWPSVALKLLTPEIKITDEDLRKGYEANYGQRVKCRAIVLNNQRKAQEVWQMAREKPTADHFGKLAEEYSVEAASKALLGKVPPIQKHGGQPLLEKEAFTLKPGELSSIIQVTDKYIILMCEGYTEPTKVGFEEVKQDIFNDIHEKKQRLAMAERFTQLKESAQIDNLLAGTVQSPNKKASATGEVKTAPARAGAVTAPANAPQSKSQPRAAAMPQKSGVR